MRAPARIAGLLSWYDEDPAWLHDSVTAAAPLLDHLVAVDGPYADFPGADTTPYSPAEQTAAILDAAAAAGVPVTLYQPWTPWQGGEVAKRDFTVRLAETVGADWLLVFDADEVFVSIPGDVRERLARTDAHVAELHLRQPEYPNIPSFVRRLLRLLPGISYSHAHSLVTCVHGGRRLILSGDPAMYQLEPVEPMHDVVMEHRRLQRPAERQRRRDAYYAVMPQIEGRLPY